MCVFTRCVTLIDYFKRFAVPLFDLNEFPNLLSFPDEPVVTLSEKCRGVVKINNRSVCSRNWNFDYSHLACQEQQDCRDAVFNDSTPSNSKIHLQHVACEGYHAKLGQCHSFEGPCPEGQVSVYCIGTWINPFGFKCRYLLK